MHAPITSGELFSLNKKGTQPEEESCAAGPLGATETAAQHACPYGTGILCHLMKASPYTTGPNVSLPLPRRVWVGPGFSNQGLALPQIL